MTAYEFIGEVDYRGRVAIPKNIRELLKTEKGTKIRVKVARAEEEF
jgi:AbrB family looped-hinge helix DNA binding protein